MKIISINQLALLLITALVGSFWSVGYLVAPTLFATVADRALAGTVAGNLFYVQACFSIFCSILLLGLYIFFVRVGTEAQRKKIIILLLLILLFTLLYFALRPYMAELRLALHTVGDEHKIADAKRWFAILHGLSSSIYCIQSVLGGYLVLSSTQCK